MTDARIAITTVPSRELGLEIARKVVQDRLAACVNISAEISSVYWWQKKVEESQEYLLIIKTTQEKAGALRQRIQELHEYEVPEFLVVTVESGVENYLTWIRESVR